MQIFDDVDTFGKRVNTCLLALPSIGHSPKKKCCLLGTTARNCWKQLLLIRRSKNENAKMLNTRILPFVHRTNEQKGLTSRYCI